MGHHALAFTSSQTVVHTGGVMPKGSEEQEKELGGLWLVDAH